jgi:hypothetical protein
MTMNVSCPIINARDITYVVLYYKADEMSGRKSRTKDPHLMRRKGDASVGLSVTSCTTNILLLLPTIALNQITNISLEVLGLLILGNFDKLLEM